MKKTDQCVVHVSYPTPFAVWGKDLQTTDGLAPEDGYAAKVWDDTCCRVFFVCVGIRHTRVSLYPDVL